MGFGKEFLSLRSEMVTNFFFILKGSNRCDLPFAGKDTRDGRDRRTHKM